MFTQLHQNHLFPIFHTLQTIYVNVALLKECNFEISKPHQTFFGSLFLEWANIKISFFQEYKNFRCCPNLNIVPHKIYPLLIGIETP